MIGTIVIGVALVSIIGRCLSAAARSERHTRRRQHDNDLTPTQLGDRYYARQQTQREIEREEASER